MPRAILTSAAMRAAERQALEAGTPETELMERAGRALASAICLYAGPRETLVLCGPGNNGGDGYVAARILAERGYPVRVAAIGEPAAGAARWARGRWNGPLEPFTDARAAPIVVDCLFGTGLREGLEPAVAQRLFELVTQALVAVACDVPSGIEADSGAMLSPVAAFDVTVSFGALKPAHRLMPAMTILGRVVLADIGLSAQSPWFEIDRATFPKLDPAGHKYSRGLVHCIAGEMPGAISLAASAAARSGAGYVRVSTPAPIPGLPASIVQTGSADLQDQRVGCVLVGPGLGQIPPLLTLALTVPRPIVIDGDAIGLVGEPQRLIGHDVILTPHEGEFARLFGTLEGPKPERALEAARLSGAIIVYKGPDSLVASPDGRLGFAPPAPPWLATAGSGDVLAGMIAGLRAQGLDAFDAAVSAVFLHGRAAELAGPTMTADDLLGAIALALRAR